ncbi:SGNH/GDSL hydrolase family protein [Paraburkholderia sp. DD10]|jgi:phospholipase/lecithinase/hemolysin|uniref:Phospholipase/lecithinase/hemolysin n=1 Tax=Paraburkholderia terricola TaxID=169427 RepID=A0A1M6P744_9BURK|nr:MULTISPECIES: SGNH/GDSL hydrolase family protein [Paraburkholderia]ORC48654.1 acylhydrolase [Burkholderia sp. A27]AXE93469.1 acylhydrolase [Paraburkholderia terricola]MDR6491887.1 phospholipase/lecithinase/hemolysin [Paraburkholderia terricola]SDO28230.1 Phospholipase/lecithinase/hemolysin [Paraburkholderia sediminicola]SHK03735.1 Phospholipase/lecithinase/hemolysin [Paraburkholderia terricola]
MNQTASRKQRWSRVTKVTLASTAFALLAACGGGDDNNNSSSTPAGGVKLQIVSFGDSLSDVGTYAPVIQGSFGGGRFTTNPGEVWTQKVAEYYGDTLSAAALGGFGQPLVNTSGYGYAQGGARVVDPNGPGHAAAGQPSYAQATTVPVVTQVQNYLSAHGSFNSNQLVLVNGGANDIFVQLSALTAAIQTDIAGGMDAQTAVLKETQNTLVPVAVALAQQVGVILQNGATHVVVANVPDIGSTPLAQSLIPTSGPLAPTLLSGITKVYNAAFFGALQQAGIYSKVIPIDAYTWQDTLMANASASGFTVTNTGTACNLTAMAAAAAQYGVPNPSAYASSLFCSPQTYTVAGADQTYMFADTVHPTTHVHALFAQYVQQQIAASGLGK